MQRRRLVPVIAALLLLVVASGCLGAGGDGTTTEPGSTDAVITSDMSAEAVQQAVLNASDRPSTYEMYMNMTMSVDGDQFMSMTMDGVVNSDAKKARADMSVSSAMADTTAEMYIANETVYMKIDDRWRTRSVGQASGMGGWNQTAQMERQRRMLSNASVSLAGSTTVDGTETTVLEVDPDTTSLTRMIGNQQGLTGSDVEITDMTVEMYVANRTGRLRQSDVEMTMDVQGQTATTDVTIELSNFGLETDIQVPEEATRDAA